MPRPASRPAPRTGAVRLAGQPGSKSRYSNGSGVDCVEVSTDSPGLVPARDSKAPHAPVLVLTATAWAPFVASLKSR
ncbi:DUF397 domain-containing protein [Streptomyces sp. NPDC096040]|uniref:DUF397 domain-containing protein n=1 Tax=Streptomyces sp. NPDC096040 TaxID=3155541 RepID=UPI003319DDE8